MGAFESGSEFIKGILAKLPEGLRNQPLDQILASAEAKEALTFAGDGVLARSDYSKNMDSLKQREDALTEDYNKLNTWYAENSSALEEYKKLKAQSPVDPNKPRDPNPAGPDLSKFVDLETFGKTMNEQQMQAANYLGLQNALTLQHYDRFKEVIDTRDLLADKNLGKQKADGSIYGLKDAYQAKYADKLSEYDKQQHRALIDKEVQERLAEERKNQPANQPFPLKAAPSALDLLEPDSKEKPSDFTPERAAAFYQELVSKSGG